MEFFDYIFGVLKCFTVLIHVEICTGSQCTGSPIVDMTGSYYLLVSGRLSNAVFKSSRMVS